MRGIKAKLLAPLLVMISTSMTCIVKCRTIRRVPLHNPTDGSRLRNNIINVPILSGNLCEGMPLTSKVLRNSEGYVFATSVSFAEFAPKKSTRALEGSLKPSRLLAKPPCCEEPKSRTHTNTCLWPNLCVVKGRLTRSQVTG